MPSIILSYTLYLPSEVRKGVSKVKGCKSKDQALNKLKRELKQKHKDMLKVEF